MPIHVRANASFVAHCTHSIVLIPSREGLRLVYPRHAAVPVSSFPAWLFFLSISSFAFIFAGDVFCSISIAIYKHPPILSHIMRQKPGKPTTSRDIGIQTKTSVVIARPSENVPRIAK